MNSPWSPRDVLAQKNRDLRFYVDYIKLNDVKSKDCFTLPQIDETLKAYIRYWAQW